MSLDHELRQGLVERQAQAQYRSRRLTDSAQGAEIMLDGRRVLNFCANDYLGLANHPQVVAAFTRAAQHYGVGSGASHLINGHSRLHHELEAALAEFTQRPRALLFSTGYMANLGVISALTTRGDHVFEDHLNHASLLDAALLSKARLQRYRHNNMADLQVRLTASQGRRKLLVTDGVFSMDGDLACLAELVEQAQQHDASLMVDDAHGMGVLGKTGGGVVEQAGLGLAQVPILMGTLGKAFGTFGAFVAGSEALIETLIQHARSYIYTTALPPAIAAATLASLKLVIAEDWRREKLRASIQRFRAGAQQLGLPLMASDTAIQPLVLGDNQRAVQLSEDLLAAGIMVSAIRPPTVPEGSARLRITLSAAHSEAHIDQLLHGLASCGAQAGVR
ncbi:MAG: 8-amino-7-oxononanoate synthase [Gammaproteobacteria bacterium]